MRVPFDRGGLRQNGDAAFLFQVGRVHGALFDALVVAEGAGLAEKLVDERGLAMVDVRDDRDITQGHVLPLGYGAPLADTRPRRGFGRAPTGNDAMRQGQRKDRPARR